MDFDDEFLTDNRETRERFIDAIREARPDVMFIHSVLDHHPDHRLAGSIARDARIPASVPLVVTNFPPTAIPTVFEMDTELGNHFEPEFYVDVTRVMETKIAMLSSHKSQADWMMHIFGTEFTENMLIQGRFRGAQAPHSDRGSHRWSPAPPAGCPPSVTAALSEDAKRSTCQPLPSPRYRSRTALS